jgi:hypothetical protein
MSDEREVLCPREAEFAIAGERVVVRPLVLRDYKLVGDRLAEAQERLSAQRDLANIGILELAPLALAELPEVLALMLRRRVDGRLEPLDPAWLEQNVAASELLDVIGAVMQVNDLPGVLKKFESLRRRAQGAPAGQ